jgi:hypothetical protein
LVQQLQGRQQVEQFLLEQQLFWVALQQEEHDGERLLEDLLRHLCLP